jgi:FeS assembly protein IscX
MMVGEQSAIVDGTQRGGEPLNWESSYAIALALIAHYPGVDIETVSLGMIYRWVIALPDFDDDPELANDEILSAIYQEWFEEVNAL